ncbi:MAG: MalY/PatB family protein [Oscillospiraceae bacterium]
MKETVQFVDRHGTSCLKWDLTEKIFGQPDMLAMWVADMDYRCPACVHEAFLDYMKCGAYGYSALDKRFFTAFTQWEKERHGCAVDESWVRFSPGVVPAINWCISTMTEPGDRVLILPPVYFPFFSAVTDNDRVLVESRLRWDGQSFTMDFRDIEAKIVSENVKMLLFCSPHNPVGRVWRREELEALLAICRKHRVLIVSDEIHQDYTHGHTHTPMASLTQQDLVMLTAPSKTFNLAGLSTAVAVIPQEDLREKWDAFTKKIHVTSGNTFGSLAGEAAYLHGAEWLDQMKEIIYGNYLLLREKLLAGLPALQVAPLEGTYLMWVDFGAYLKPEEQKDFFVNRCRIAVNYGSAFGGGADSWIRFNLATSRENVEKAADTIVAALRER